MSQVFKFGTDSNSHEISFDSKGCVSQHSDSDDKLHNLFSKWGDKINQLESQIQDVRLIKLDVGKTLQKARRKPQQLNNEDKENKDSQNLRKLPLIECQKNTSEGYSFTYQYNQQQPHDISLEFKNESFIDVQLRSEGWWSKVDNVVLKRPIGQFLLDASVDQYINNFLDVAVYENQLLFQHLKDDGCWNNLLLRKFGVDKIGHRKSIYIQLMEDCHKYDRIGLLKYSQSFDSNELPTTKEWLNSINLLSYYPNFVLAGYDNFERLIVIQNSEVGFQSANILLVELGIDDAQVGQTLFEQLQKITSKMVTFNFGDYLKKINNQPQAKPVMCGLQQVSNQCSIY